jgi:preprotein translocase subunit YajC
MPDGAAGNIMNFLLPIGMIVVLFAVMILPQRKKNKQVQKMLSEIKPGDKIRTIGGMYGKVVKIDDKTVTVEVGPDKVRMPFVKSAIATVDNSPDATEADSLPTDAAK